MTIFYVCRHGETENNKRKRLMGWTDTPLTEEGRLNAKSSASKLKAIHIDQIVSSDLGRAFATAYIISRQLSYASEIEMSAGLREMNYGDLANQPYDAYPALAPEEILNFTPPNGESLAQMQKRVLDCVGALGTRYNGKTVLLVAHDGTINALKAEYKQTSMVQEDKVHNAHDFVAKLVWNDNEIRSFEEIGV